MEHAHKLTTLLLTLCASLIACASDKPIQATKADFNGGWSVK